MNERNQIFLNDWKKEVVHGRWTNDIKTTKQSMIFLCHGIRIRSGHSVSSRQLTKFGLLYPFLFNDGTIDVIKWYLFPEGHV